MAGFTPAWPAEEQTLVRKAVAEGKSSREIAAITGRSAKAVLCGVQRYRLGKWPCLDDRPMPEGFADDAKVMGITRLMAKHNCGRANVNKWRKELEITGVAKPYKDKPGRVPKLRLVKPPRTPKRPREPKQPRSDFTRQSAEKTRAIAKPGYMTAPVDRGYKEDSAAGEAQRVLQRDGWKPVVRCTAEGRQDPKGRFWICGRSVAISDAELIERAGRALRRMAA